MQLSRRRAVAVAASCLAAPLVVLWTSGGTTVFFSMGYVAPRAGFVDVVRYATELTRGTFWAGYRFWLLAGPAAVAATAAAALDRRGVAAAVLAAGAVAVLRFWWALASHTGEGTLVPVGAVWFLAAAAVLATAPDPPPSRIEGGGAARPRDEEKDT